MNKLWTHDVVDNQFGANDNFRCRRGEFACNASAVRRFQQRQNDDDRKLLRKRGDTIVAYGPLNPADNRATNLKGKWKIGYGKKR